MNEFTETKFDQRVTFIKIIRVHYKDSTSDQPGLFMGVELFDFAGKTVVKAGFHANVSSKYQDVELVMGERIIGIKCGRRG